MYCFGWYSKMPDFGKRENIWERSSKSSTEEPCGYAYFGSLTSIMPKVLFLGDIVGRPGRTHVVERIASLKKEMSADFVIANGENAAGGAGITGKIVNELIQAGVDAITLGDHIWDQKNFENEIGDLEDVCRPANLPEQNPGRTHLIIERNGFRLGIFTVLGRNFIALKSDCPFKTADGLLETLKSNCDAVFVEAHMEATSEKIALGWYLDGRAAAVIGTHTHQPEDSLRNFSRNAA